MTVPFAADPETVRSFVVETLRDGPQVNLAKHFQDRFGVSRATAHNYLRELIAGRVIQRTGPGKYQLFKAITRIHHSVQGLEEHEVWAKEILPLVRDLPTNILDILRFGCTEMINNVIDHSQSPSLGVVVTGTAASIEVEVHDNGVGIFRKIRKALNLEDDRHSVLELSKGKVTTDPERHSGHGIFFSSRAFDSFQILSGGVFFNPECHDERDWILGDEEPTESVDGTSVTMTLATTSDRKLKDVFDKYATDENQYGFDRTVVPVKLLQYGDDHLVSRSQAKRLLARIDRFKIVVLNFGGLESIGQAFADEVFRVFPSQNPEVELVPMNTNEQVARMISRATGARQPQADLFTTAEGPRPEHSPEGAQIALIEPGDIQKVPDADGDSGPR